ncbi:MAG: hypothetical protein M0Z80_01645 [Treponema sp.]|nr:hypothetical protein [Treponema sp.]
MSEILSRTAEGLDLNPGIDPLRVLAVSANLVHNVRVDQSP